MTVFENTTASLLAVHEGAAKKAWEEYYTSFKELTEYVEQSEQYAASPRQRARAYTALSEVQAIAYNFAVAPRLLHPRLFQNTSWQNDTYSIGGNGPDFLYKTVFLDGSQTYRLTGRANDSDLLLAQLNNALPGTPGSRVLANYDFSDFEIAADGTFEIILSADKHDGNWIQLYKDAPFQWMLFRPTAEGWDKTAAELHIERISEVPLDHYEADEFDDDALARRIRFASGYASYLVKEWMVEFWPKIKKNAGGVNKFAAIGTAISGEVGSPAAEYVQAAFEVGDDEALIITLHEEPKGVHWSFQLQDVWLRSLDFRTRQSALNRKQIRKDGDGKIRVVVARTDPGVHNWIDTLGYEQGLITMRHYFSPETVVPEVVRVPFNEIKQHLPSDTPVITPKDRVESLRKRRIAYLNRHGE